MESGSDKKLLSELRVTELRQELEKRSLDKNGIKIILADRLEKAIRAEGHDPAKYLFVVSEPVGGSGTTHSPVSNCKEPSPVNQRDSSSTSVSPLPTLQASENGHSVSKTVEIEVKNASTNGNNMETTTAGCAPDVKVMETTEDQEEMLDDPLADVASGEDSSTASTLTNQHSKTLALQRVQAPVTGDDREKEASSRSLWIRGLTSATKAADLKALFSLYGKVVRAKIFTSKKQTTSACFGYVTMSDVTAADKSAISLHKTQFKGRAISVEKADKSKVPAVKVAAAPVVRKEAKVEETKSDTEKEKRDENKEESVESAPSVRRESVEKKREEKPREDRKSAGGSSRRRDSERGPSKTFHSSEKREDRRPFRDPRRDAQRMIASAPRRFPVPGSRNIVHRNSISHRLTRPGDRSTLPPSAMLRRPEAWDRRDMMDLIRRKEEEHRRREQELERERALERERERIRFEREQLEKERLQLQLQAALQQQKLASLSSRNKDTFAVPSQHSSRNRGAVNDYRSSGSRDTRDKVTSSGHHRSSDSRRVSSGRHLSGERGVSSRVERSSRGEHRSTSHSSGSNSTSRDRSRHESFGVSSRHTPSTYASRDTTAPSYNNGSSFYGTSRDAYSSGSRDPGYSSSRVSGTSGWGAASGSSGTFGSSSAWTSSSSALGGSGSNWSRTGSGEWSAFGGSGGGTGSVRYDYDKYQRRF